MDENNSEEQKGKAEEEKTEEGKTIDEGNKNKTRIKWPLFGYNLIKEEYGGDISKEIYKYISTDHKEKSLCVLGMLFPETDSK